VQLKNGMGLLHLLMLSLGIAPRTQPDHKSLCGQGRLFFYEGEVAQALSAAEPSRAELVRVFDSSWGDGPYADMSTRPTIDVALLGSAGRHPRHDSARIINRETHLVGVRGHVPGVNRVIPDRIPYARHTGKVTLFEFGTIRDGINRAARSQQ